MYDNRDSFPDLEFRFRAKYHGRHERSTLVAHRCIVFQWSEPLRDMVVEQRRHNRGDDEHGRMCIDIDEEDPDLFCQMVEFMYRGKVDTKRPLALMRMAERWSVSHLAERCRSSIAKDGRVLDGPRRKVMRYSPAEIREREEEPLWLYAVRLRQEEVCA